MRYAVLMVSICVCLSALAGAQAGSSASAQAAQAPASVASSVDREVSAIEKDFVSLADAMPEEKYNYAPTNGEFKGVRTFAQQVKHVAALNYMLWSAALKEKPPVELGEGMNGPDSIKSKAEMVKFLKDSFAYGHRAAAALTPENMLETAPFGPRTNTRLFWATYAVAHGFDHYGQAVEYARANGVIPPASRGKQ